MRGLEGDWNSVTAPDDLPEAVLKKLRFFQLTVHADVYVWLSHSLSLFFFSLSCSQFDLIVVMFLSVFIMSKSVGNL